MASPNTDSRTHGANRSRFQANVAWLGRYSGVGLLGAAVHYSILWIMVEKLRIPVLVATSVVFVLVTIENYVLHHGWTFASTHSHTIAFPKFVFMNIIGFWINWGYGR